MITELVDVVMDETVVEPVVGDDNGMKVEMKVRLPAIEEKLNGEVEPTNNKLSMAPNAAKTSVSRVERGPDVPFTITS